MALPSSDANSSITCHGLGPRPAADMLAFNACGAANLWSGWIVQLAHISLLGAASVLLSKIDYFSKMGLSNMLPYLSK